MMSSQKGMVYTLSLTLLALVLLALATLYIHQQQAEQELFAELGGRQRVYDVEQSVQAAFTEVLMKEAGFRFSTASDSFTVKSSFPQNMTNLAFLFEMIKNNTERDFPFIALNVSPFSQNQEFIFLPSAVHYIQKNSSEIAIEPGQNGGGQGGSSSSITGYNVSLTFSANVTSCVSNIKSGDTLTVTVYAVSPFGTCVFPKTTLKELTLDMVSQGKNVHLEVGKSEEVALSLRGETPLTSSIMVLVQPLPEHGSIELPITMTVNQSASSYTKSSRISVIS